MIRVVISLDADDKNWLQHIAKAEQVSMAEVIRHAIGFYRHEIQTTPKTSLKELLSSTKGIWKHGDGLKYQRKIRSEWK